MPQSKAYHLFVTKEQDLIGHIAYSLYQRAKWIFIDNYTAQNGTAPSEREIETFRISHTTPLQIEMYRSRAHAMLDQTLGGILEEELQQYKQEIKDNIHGTIQEAIKPLTPSRLESILIGLASSGLFALLLLVLFALSVVFRGGDISSIFSH